MDDSIDIDNLLKDQERLEWLFAKGVAWRGCYKDDWKEGEWLYFWQNPRDEIDKAMKGMEE